MRELDRALWQYSGGAPSRLRTMSIVSSIVLLSATACDRAPVAPVLPQQAKDAVLALKKLEARIQSGVNYDDYIRALGDARFSVNLFTDSQEAKKYLELVKTVKDAMSDYQFA